MNEDLNIYDGSKIEGSSEAKSRSTWVEMFDMIGRNICSFIKLSKTLMIYELLPGIWSELHLRVFLSFS